MRPLEKAIVFFCGVLFSVGLVLGGMTQPSKVIGFLDFTGDWDPSLIMVMVGAIAIYMPVFRLLRGRSAPLFGARFWIPTRRDIDLRLIAGAAIFGVGWGLAGYCPGPGITSLGTGGLTPISFVVGMLVGMAIFRVAIDRLAGSKAQGS